MGTGICCTNERDPNDERVSIMSAKPGKVKENLFID